MREREREGARGRATLLRLFFFKQILPLMLVRFRCAHAVTHAQKDKKTHMHTHTNIHTCLLKMHRKRCRRAGRLAEYLSDGCTLKERGKRQARRETGHPPYTQAPHAFHSQLTLFGLSLSFFSLSYSRRMSRCRCTTPLQVHTLICADPHSFCHQTHNGCAWV